MNTSASARDRFYRTIEPLLGAEAADFLMDAIPPTDWSEVATKSDIRELRAELRAEMREGFAGCVSRDELGTLLQLHVDARMGAISRNLFFAIATVNITMMAGLVAAVRL